MASDLRRRETGEITAESALQGEKLYQVRARATLPILVRQAKAAQRITYSDLAAELGMPNPRNLNYVLGTIGNALLRLGNEWNAKIPPIQSVVISKRTGLPGEGISWFISNREEFERSNKWKQERLIKQMLEDVFSYEHWDEVLARFGLPAAKNPLPSVSKITRLQYGSGGESDEHKHLKQYVARNPELVGLSPRKAGHGEVEYLFPSGDALDVLFITDQEWVGAEVKSRRSGTEDVLRGLYQCVKYQALLEALQRVEQVQTGIRTVLLLEGVFPIELLALKNVLGIAVIDNVGMSTTEPRSTA